MLLSVTPTLDRSQAALYQLPCHRCPPCSSHDPIACHTLTRTISARGALKKKTLTRQGFSKMAITFLYGLGIRQIFFSRTSTEKVTSVAPRLCRVPPNFFSQIWLERLSIRAAKFLHAFQRTFLIFYRPHFAPFELKIYVVVACVLLVQKKILEKYKKKIHDSY